MEHSIAHIQGQPLQVPPQPLQQGANCSARVHVVPVGWSWQLESWAESVRSVGSIVGRLREAGDAEIVWNFGEASDRYLGGWTSCEAVRRIF